MSATPISPRQTPYERLGGAPALERLVHTFYDLMSTQAEFAPLRALHAADLGHSRERLIWFLSGWLGGPQLYVERVGHPRLRARHLGVRIGIAQRDQWLACMHAALDACACPSDLRLQLGQSFFQTADWMRNLDTDAPPQD